MDELFELREFCEEHRLPWTEETEARFASYVTLLEQFNAKMNLIGPFDRTEIVRQLFVDSVAPAVLAAPDGSILDIGTGAGFPGIPLKILYPDVPITLVEPRKKRAMFLKIATTRLKLEDVEIVRERIEDTEIVPHDWVVSKAFRNPDVWLEIAKEWVSEEGVIVAMHSTDHRPTMLERASELDLEVVADCDDTTSFGLAATEVVRGITVWAVSK